jgi:RNA polymerase sigma-70 factor (ECF subfamily)
MTDSETAQRIHEGDPDAIREFIRLHYQAIYRLLRRLTLNAEDAEDLTQQTFVKARLKAGDFRARASLSTWLHKIAIHEYTHWKRAQRKTGRLNDAAATVEDGYPACLDAIVVGQALARLPDAQREAFLLVELQEMSITEAADVLSVPQGTVKSRVHHARLAMRAFLQRGTEVSNDDERVLEPR